MHSTNDHKDNTLSQALGSWLLTGRFSAIMQDLHTNLEANRESFMNLIKKNPNLSYYKVNELAKFVGSRYSIELQLHFPESKRILEFDSYGRENVGVVVDKFRKKFPLPREDIKLKASEIISLATAQDAYMYEGKEGVKVILPEGRRIEVLPGSVHFWCVINSKVLAYGDWLFDSVYRRI